MAITSIGDLSQTLSLKRQNAALKLLMQEKGQEVTTGRVADAGRALRGDFAPLAAIDTSLARLEGFLAATTEAGTVAGVMQTTLTTLSDLASDLASSLLTTAGSGLQQQVTSLGQDARQRLESAMGMLNTQFADKALFSGVESGRPPLPDAASFLTTLEGVVAGAVSAADVELMLTTWFEDPAGYAALYQGGAPRAAMEIGPGDQVTIDVTALDPGIRDTLKGLSMAALLDRGVLQGVPSGRADLARHAGLSLTDTASARTLLSAEVGLAEERILQAKTRNGAETSALQIARTTLVEAGPYEAATRLEQAETQLEALYSVTVRLSRLSLSDYLR
jgi:flagellar hook-associated protein 3 FlgL